MGNSRHPRLRIECVHSVQQQRYSRQPDTWDRAAQHKTILHNEVFGRGDFNVYDGFYFPNAVQDVDGNWYGAVILGDQVWMAENLRTKHFGDLTSIAYGGENYSSETPYYYYPFGQSSNDTMGIAM